MIKDYINVRVFVLLDLSLAATWILLSIGGWSVIKQYPQVDAIIWGIISVPLALIGVAMIYQRANLVHRKHVNIQHIYEQEQEIRLIHLRQQQSLPYPKDDYQENLLFTHQPVERLIHSGQVDMDMMSSRMTSDVQSEEDEIEAPVYTPLEEAIYHNEKNKADHKACYTDDQMAKRFAVSAKTIQRTRNGMKGQGKLS